MTETVTEITTSWRIHWSGVIVGALAAAAVVSALGLIGIALGAHQFEPENRVVNIKAIGFGTLALSVFGAFLAFVVGGWVVGKIAGLRRCEPAMLHGAIVWLVAVPMLYLFSMLGAGSMAGGWFAGLTASPDRMRAETPYERSESLMGNASNAERELYQTELATYRKQVAQWRQDTPKVIRNSALGALTAILLGLIGAVLGGWMASGEPMHFKTFRTVSASS